VFPPSDRSIPKPTLDVYQSCCRKLQPGGEDEDSQDEEEEEDYFCRNPEKEENGKTVGTVIDAYKTTYKAAKVKKNNPTDKNGQSRSSNHSTNKTKIWKTPVVGPLDENVQIAHLVPAAVDHANSYWFVTDFLFGMGKERTWKEVLRILHGSKGHKKKSRTPNTGIKHMVTNKVLLHGQALYFDKYPACVVIVPILALQEALDWRGGGYEAIMLIDKYAKDNGEEITLSEVCHGTHFSAPGGQEAGPKELTTACTLLQNYTRAILFGQRKRKPRACGFLLDDAVRAFYPELPKDLNDLKVRKVRFEDNEGTEGHPAPDPLLLVTKAVTVLQKRKGFRITAAAEPIEDSDYRPSDLSILAEEEFLRRREEAMVYPDPVGLCIDVSH
jgi:hypothetical protein